MTTPISVNLMPTAPVGRVVELARLAEQLGCRRCWVYDEGLVTRDVYVTLTAIAAATDRIQLGPGITNPWVRHPGATAGAIAALDEVSGGRAFLGLGAGGGLTLGPLAIERRRPLRAVEHTVAALRDLFAGAEVTMEAETFGFDRARLASGPHDIEILLAGRGPRMIDLGGRTADGFYLSYIHKDLLADEVGRLRAAAGGRPFTVVWSTAIATTDEELEAVRAQLTFRLVDSPDSIRHRVGLDDDRRDRIRAALADGGPSAAAHLIEPSWVDAFALVGSPTECLAELERTATDLGIDEFLLPVSSVDRGAEVIERVCRTR
ncbi:MAG: LLM class flavin-dependent oxidoreductase [Actinomycetota bacterium]